MGLHRPKLEKGELFIEGWAWVDTSVWWWEARVALSLLRSDGPNRVRHTKLTFFRRLDWSHTLFVSFYRFLHFRSFFSFLGRELRQYISLLPLIFCYSCWPGQYNKTMLPLESGEYQVVEVFYWDGNLKDGNGCWPLIAWQYSFCVLELLYLVLVASVHLKHFGK